MAAEIHVVELPEQPTAAVREEVPMAQIREFFDRVFGELRTLISQGEIRPAGPPFALYRGMPTDTVDVEAGFPVLRPIEVTGAVRPGVLPRATVYQCVHPGPFENLRETYDAVLERIEADAAVAAGFVWEVYLTDPATEPDPQLWRTLVCCPVL